MKIPMIYKSPIHPFAMDVMGPKGLKIGWKQVPGPYMGTTSHPPPRNITPWAIRPPSIVSGQVSLQAKIIITILES
jgi:hypothetical protein